MLTHKDLLGGVKWITIKNKKTNAVEAQQDGMTIREGWTYLSGNDQAYHPERQYNKETDSYDLTESTLFSSSYLNDNLH